MAASIWHDTVSTGKLYCFGYSFLIRFCISNVCGMIYSHNTTEQPYLKISHNVQHTYKHEYQKDFTLLNKGLTCFTTDFTSAIGPNI